MQSCDENLVGIPIEGRLYVQEVDKINPQVDIDFKIEHILKNTKGWACVKFGNWPGKFNNCVKKKDLRRIQ